MSPRHKVARGACVRRLRALVVMLAVAAPLRADWTLTYPWKGQPYSGSVVAAGDARVYACSGLEAWLVASDDGGRTWSKTSPLTTSSSVVPVDIVSQPHSPDTVVIDAEGLEAAIFRTADAGATWQRVGAYVHVAVDPVDPNVMYASRGYPSFGGIVKTVDGGITWSDTARKNSLDRAIVVDVLDHQTVYAIGIDVPEQKTAGLYRTRDGGATWPSIYPGYNTILSLTVDVLDRLYAIVESEFALLLLRSTNQGDSWSRLRITVPPVGGYPDVRARAVAIDPRMPQRLYVGTLEQGVVASFDDGVTWEVLGNLPSHFVNAITVTGDGAVLAATPDGIYRYMPTPPRRRAIGK